MLLIKSSHDIQLWQLVGFPIKIYGMTLNLNSIMYRGYLWGLNQNSKTLSHNIIIISLTCYTNNYLGRMAWRGLFQMDFLSQNLASFWPFPHHHRCGKLQMCHRPCLMRVITMMEKGDNFIIMWRVRNIKWM